MMLRKLLTGALALGLVALASGCARFTVPETGRAPYIHLTEADIANRHWAVTDEAARFQIKFHPDGTLWAKNDGPFRAIHGRWRVNDKSQLCLKSLWWWKQGTCWAVYGHGRVPEAVTPQKKHLLDKYLPVEVLG